MRTNINLDDQLMDEAFKYAHISTKTGLIHLALEEFIQNHRRKDIRQLKGKIQFDPQYDYKTLRK